MFTCLSIFIASLPAYLVAAFLLTSGISIMGLSDNLVRLVSDQVGLGQYHFLRSAMSIAIFLCLRPFLHFQLAPTNWRPVFWRTLCLSLSMTLFFSVLSFLPVALAGAGLFTSPVFVLVFSFLFFGVRPGWRRIVAVICGSLGVFLVLRPDAQSFHLLQLLPILAGAFYAGASLITRPPVPAQLSTRRCWPGYPVAGAGLATRPPLPAWPTDDGFSLIHDGPSPKLKLKCDSAQMPAEIQRHSGCALGRSSSAAGIDRHLCQLVW